MKKDQQFDFSIQQSESCLWVKRRFQVQSALLWRAWTEAALLDQWWAPKPYTAQTKKMDFRPGGYWLYAMISPEAAKHWGKFEYRDIQTPHSFRGFDAFCDEQGNLTSAFPGAEWQLKFLDDGATSALDITITFENVEALNAILEMGFKEGFNMGLQNLEELLQQWKA